MKRINKTDVNKADEENEIVILHQFKFKIEIFLSSNLYKYIGNGFDCYFCKKPLPVDER